MACESPRTYSYTRISLIRLSSCRLADAQGQIDGNFNRVSWLGFHSGLYRHDIDLVLFLYPAAKSNVMLEKHFVCSDEQQVCFHDEMVSQGHDIWRGDPRLFLSMRWDLQTL